VNRIPLPRRIATLAARRLLRLIAFVGIALAPATVPAADMNKTLHVSFPIAENGFDPQAVYDTYSFEICHAIFDTLYTYDYFARPVQLKPNTADGLPQITDGGRTFTVKLRPGIYFADDPAFQGKKRELVAEDYVYSLKRIIDPKVRSYWLYLFDHRLVGLDDALARARKTGRFDYDQKIEGLQTLDRYTLRVRFKSSKHRRIRRTARWITRSARAHIA
jgi:ABC-type transport system substrate-binding protein